MSNEFLKSKIRKFYDLHPCGGDWEKDDARYTLLPWLDDLFEYDKHANELLLDVGCGIGIDLLKYIENGSHVVGVDLAEKPLKILKSKMESAGFQPRLIRCDLENMPLKKGVFDFVYSIGVLHHTPGYDKGIKEIHRVLKNNGKVIVLLYHKYSLATIITKINKFLYRIFGEKLLRVFESIVRRRATPAEISAFKEMWEHPLIKYFTRSEAENTFRNARFKNIRIQMFDSLYPLSRIFPRMSRRHPVQKFGRFLVVKANK